MGLLIAQMPWAICIPLSPCNAAGFKPAWALPGVPPAAALVAGIRPWSPRMPKALGCCALLPGTCCMATYDVPC
jgi:hypothetical protein